MSLAVSSATCLPPLRCALGQGPLPSPHRQYLPSFSSISGVAKRERSVDSPEDEDALPLLMSMAQIQTKAAMESSRLPTISSILPSLHTTFGASTSQFSQMAPATPSDRASSSSPVPQSSPPSPSTLSPGLFGSSSLITTSSASSTSFGAASSRLIPSTASHQQQAYVSATNSLMELSDIISSTPALHQKLPVPLSASEAEAPSEDSGDDNDADNEYGVDSDGHPTCSSPVSSRTRRVTRSQQRQIERIRSEIERERERARELERTLHLALRERSELLAGKRAQVGGLSFVNVLNATEDGSQPQQQQMFVDLPTGTQSLPSPSGQPPRPSSEGRSRSAPMLPPIGSIPALSPYLARKRGSLPSSAALSASSATTSPSSSPLRSAAPEPAAAHARAQLSRRRKSVDREDDEDYEPTAAAKKIKRSRSMSEGGRRLQASSSTRRRRSESQYQSRDLGGEDDHAGQVAAAFMAMRAKAIEEERRARESRLMMDVVEGADQEGDGDDDEDDECHHTQHRQSRVASGAHARRDSLLDFIKDHPHASFWLKARN